MREVGQFVILFAAVLLWLAVVAALKVTFVTWKTRWARAAHVTASLAITAALAFGIHQLGHAMSPGACVGRHAGQVCVKEPLD
jgi:F0F1-type ATP synthase membrane subunit a